MRQRSAIRARIVVIITCLVLTISTLAGANDQEDLAKESQNPIGNMISLPFENNTHFKLGPDDKWANVLNLKPVYPVTSITTSTRVGT